MAKLTKQQYRKNIPLLLDLMEKETKPCGLAGREQRKRKAKEDFWYFFRHYLPHYAEQNSPAFHKEIIAMLENQEIRRMSVAAPRGFSKSTLVSFAYVVWSILFEKYYFIVLVSATDALAKDLADFIRLEFTDNQRIIEDFGHLLLGQGAEGDFTANKTRVLARGRKQAVRGFRSRQHRPDLIILDDIEKDEEALSPKVVLKTLDAVQRGLVPSLKPGGKLVFIGTILRKRSVSGTLLLSEDEPWNLWTRKIYRAVEPDGNGNEVSLWEERFPLEFLQEQKRTMGLSAFNAEYQNMPSDEDTALFTEAMIRDGAPEANAAMVQGSDTKFFKEICAIYRKYKNNILAVAVESNGFQAYFLRELQSYAEAEGLTLPLTAVKNSLKKEHRIARLVPLFETGKICFEPEFRRSRAGKILIEQLLYFPSSAVHDDGPDALDGAVKVLEARTSAGSGISFLPRAIKKGFRSSFFR